MLLSFVYLAVRRLLELLVLGRRSQADKDLEVVILRRELAVLRRQVKRPQFRAQDRAFLAVASRVLSRKRWAAFMVRPETLLRWHGPWSSGSGRGRIDASVVPPSTQRFAS